MRETYTLKKSMSKTVRKRVRVKKEKYDLRLINQFWQLKGVSGQ